MKELTVVNHDGVEVVDSREVAEMIGKQHKHLLRDISKYVEILEKAGESNFGPSDFFIKSSYVNAQNKEQPCYLITKQGCEMVANKMTGEKGVLFTAAYVQAFNKMHDTLVSQQQYTLPHDYISALKALVQSEEEKLQLIEENKIMKPKAEYYDLIMQSDKTILITKIAKDYGMTAYQMNKLLAELGVQYKVDGTWVLYKQYQGFGYVASETKLRIKNDKPCFKIETKWTQKGRVFLYNLLKENEYLPLIEQNKNVVDMDAYVY